MEADRRRRGGHRVYRGEAAPWDTLFRHFVERPALGWVWVAVLGAGAAGAFPGVWSQLGILVGGTGLAVILDRMVPRCSECGARTFIRRARCGRCQIRLRD